MLKRQLNFFAYIDNYASIVLLLNQIICLIMKHVTVLQTHLCKEKQNIG